MVDDPLLIQQIKDLLQSEKTKDPDEVKGFRILSPIDQLEREMILEALEDVLNGNVYTLDEVDKEIARWVKER